MTDPVYMDLHYRDGTFAPIPAVTSAADEGESDDAFLVRTGWHRCFSTGEEFSPLRPISWRRHAEDGSWQYLVEYGNGMEYSQYVLLDSFPEWMDLLARWAPAIQAAELMTLIADLREPRFGRYEIVEAVASRAAVAAENASDWDRRQQQDDQRHRDEAHRAKAAKAGAE